MTPDAFAEEHKTRLLAEDDIAVGHAIAFWVEKFAPTEAFQPSKPYLTLLKWRDHGHRTGNGRRGTVAAPDGGGGTRQRVAEAATAAPGIAQDRRRSQLASRFWRMLLQGLLRQSLRTA
jgi:hypothetical protein